ncbi:biotin--[acetyl-CoA-carboxylase] ligase [Anaerorudis cellulosivorans]|uniref:biotin--[acetyl-CoA-carboxylase] ligase n=1 Tax=Anaerorudis cellulosivorans TaxID=3397862 RepID=UPI00221EBBB1|nr:biotin--[acetyl-CoA-carboxylase] ligase [Seramator thermalis]MCW1734796.1 biotin--[acetyl-CoA-carboxylase] ligase [Seramator thermalis]
MDQLSKKRLVVRLDETESTNAYMKELVRKKHPEEGSIVIAEYQTEGRGQRGNAWVSAKGENLLFSLLIYPKDVPANEQFIISRIASLAIKNTLDQFADDIRIKWPNDIYWKDKKIAGILIENDLQGNKIENSIIGIGLNLNQEVFPPELPNPVSLKQITGVTYDKDYILDMLLREFFLLYRELEEGNTSTIEDEYMRDLYRANDYYWFEDAEGKFRAKIENVLPSGRLVLRTLDDDDIRAYAFKEIVFLNE